MKKNLMSFVALMSIATYAHNGYNHDERTNYKKAFNDWSLSVFGGINGIQGSDLNSINLNKFTPGYDYQIQLNRQISHNFGLSLLYQRGQTKQSGKIIDSNINYQGLANGKTFYQGLTLLGDVQMSNLFRRSDYKPFYRYSLHLYGGMGILGYNAYRDHASLKNPTEFNLIDKQGMNIASIFGQIGSGIRYRINKKLDLELRYMYVLTGDEEFDGSGKPIPGKTTPADTEESRADKMMTLSLGLHYKIGKHDRSLQWFSNNINSNIKNEEFKCIDEDKDGVCDQWDKCPGTEENVSVDGSGCPLDSDKDGIPDSKDKCPTIPGDKDNEGCPNRVSNVSGDEIAKKVNKQLEGIKFNFDSHIIRTESYFKLDNAADILLSNPEYKFIVEGHTDASGKIDYNQKLSERRAASVVKYLNQKGVSTDRLFPIGKGKSELKWKECNPTSKCPEWKNFENRRVIFKEVQK